MADSKLTKMDKPKKETTLQKSTYGTGGPFFGI